MTVRLSLSRFQAIFVFFTFSSIPLVFMVRFQLQISKLNFLSFKENYLDGQTVFLQVFGYFLIFPLFASLLMDVVILVLLYSVSQYILSIYLQSRFLLLYTSFCISITNIFVFRKDKSYACSRGVWKHRNSQTTSKTWS